MTAPVRTWLAEPLPDDVQRALERLAQVEGVVHIAAMPDVHLSHEVCVGTVLATRDRLFPAAVGGDIGCGMAAIRFPIGASVLSNPSVAAATLRGFAARIPAIRHPRGTAPALDSELAQTKLSHPSLERAVEREGRAEMGTLGRGNHFVELQTDDEGSLWLMLHSGSRAMGQAIRDHHQRFAQGGSLPWLIADSAAGRAYLGDAAWAVAYADANRRALLAAASQVIAEVFDVAGEADTLRTCHHNHVRLEPHFGESWWVHRKGAIPAALDEPGIIPGSMGTLSYHVAGRGHAEALASSSHGAGRRFSRTEARARISTRTLERELGSVWFDRRLLYALREEAPGAYKDLHAVMRAQSDLTRIVRRLRPLLVYKGA